MSWGPMAVFAVSVLLVVTKLMDCVTTVRSVGSDQAETNPLAALAMRRFGVTATVWGVFILVLLIVAIVGGSVYRTAVAATELQGRERLVSAVIVWGYVTLGSLISLVQASVALTNATGGTNSVTRLILALHVWVDRVVSGLR